MSKKERFTRLYRGLALLLVVLVVAFALLPSLIHNWGSSAEERERPMPGDELLSTSTLTWNHGIIIEASPEQVWPWIAQIGDDRGGFYSYTFIENAIAQEDLYHNANRIIPEFQDPQPGEGLIMEYLVVEAVEPGRFLLARSNGIPGLGWTWVWHLTASGQENSRLVVRMQIETEEALDNPIITYLVDISGFVMERRMLQGIKDRAEGRFDPAYSEAVEIGLWLAALISGLAAGLLFLTRKRWRLPLLIGILAVLGLLTFTFLQPPIGVRVLADLVLLGGLGWYVWSERRAA